jgi:hypothetical protein
MKKLSVLVGFTLFVLMLMQGFALAQGAKVDLSGFWSLRFEGGGSGHMTLSNTGGSGVSGNSSYTGKLVNELPRSKLRGIKTRIARVVDYVIFYTLFPVPASSRIP